MVCKSSSGASVFPNCVITSVIDSEFTVALTAEVSTHLSVSPGPGTVLDASIRQLMKISRTIRYSSYCNHYAYFAEKKTNAQRGEVIWPKITQL